MAGKVGRPSVYTEELAAEICERLANNETLSKICEDAHMPPRSTVVYWQIHDHEGFQARYAKAREAQMETMSDEILTLADDRSEDPNSRRVMVDTRKWLMARLAVNRYGDKQQVEHSGTVGFAQLVAEANAKGEGE